MENLEIDVKQLLQKEQQQKENLSWMFEALLQKSNETITTLSFLHEAVAKSVAEFLFNPDKRDTFLLYYRRYK